MNRWVWMIGGAVFVATGCESATQRCRRIELAQITAENYQRREREFIERLYTTQYSGLPRDSQRFLERALRATMKAEEDRLMDSAYKADGRNYAEAQRLIGDTNRALDSLPPEGRPPPRPSDRAWYAEHCWEGKPR